ncbi:MAG TPA: FAD-binding oxidoreductase [Nocardioides sp.]|nr:FAD-binding oxidoreductase [Nocardioides sp.]
MQTPTTAPVADLSIAGFAGELLTAADGERYDAARAVFNGMFDRRPAVIARAGTEADVASVVRHVGARGLPLAVKAGGHSVAGFSTIDDGLLLDLGPMRRIDVDPAGRTVRVEPGVTWGELDRATQQHGLATTGGRMTTTGVAGFVLGSGSGWLERLHGLACDNLVSARVVTAAGETVTASEQQNPDLFWGLRGGGGNFGVVTELELRLHPVGPTIYGGMLMYPRDRAPEVCRNLRAVMADAPRGVAAGAILMTAPPAPFVPPGLQGRPAVGVLAAYFGDLQRGPEALAGLRAVDGALVDTIGPFPYLDLQAITDAGNPHGRRNYWHSDLLADLPDEAIDALVRRADVATSPASVMILAPAGGAVADVPEDATPISGRSAPWFYHCYGTWTEGADAAHVQWVKETAGTLRPWTTSGMALNFFTQVDEDRVRSTFGAEKYARLVALKDRYDPGNLFCRNQNVRPSGAG